MKTEEIYGGGVKMVVLNVKLDNFYAFKNFELNFTYPKKIVGSTIQNEHLSDRTNFRYKKVNVILGSNASGKTTLGRVLMKIFNFIDKKNYTFITEAVCDYNKSASFSLDLASEKNIFYRVVCNIEPCTGEKYSPENIKLVVRRISIGSKDSYESCVKKIELLDFTPADNYAEELEKVDELAWFFEHPRDNHRVVNLPSKDNAFCFVLNNILKTLDPSIKSVKISKDVDKAYVINLQNRSIVIQNGQTLDTDLLSSGTKSGIEVANILWSLLKKRNGFYYCDEKFSFIQSDIEKAILSVMIDCVGDNDQFFFTTHNTDILDMDLPKHTFTFLRKDVNDTEKSITCIEASDLLKRSTDSLRNAVENDLFLTTPATELIYSILDLQNEVSKK